MMISVYYGSHLNHGLLTTDLPIFEILQGSSKPKQRNLREKRASVAAVVFGGWEDVPEEFKGLVEGRVEERS